MTPEEIDREALRKASEVHDVSLDEPHAEEILRRTMAFASWRLRVALEELVEQIKVEVEPLVRFFSRRS